MANLVTHSAFNFFYLRCVLANQICLDAIVIQPTIECTHTHSQTQQRLTSSRVVCKIQSLCNIVSLELYIIVYLCTLQTLW